MDAPRRGLNALVTRFWSLAAPLYDAPILQDWIYRPPQDEVIEALRARGSRRIADIACGTGILADRIERELTTEAVYGVDMSDGMLDAARRRSPRIQWRRGPAEQLPFDDDALDAVVSTSAFHFFDQPAALREFRRVVAPGGLVAVATIGSALPGPLRSVSADPRSPAHNPSTAEMRALFTDAGIDVTDQHRITRPHITAVLGDIITVGAA